MISSFSKSRNIKRLLLVLTGLILVISIIFFTITSGSSQNKVLRVRTEPTFPPFEMKVGDHTKATLLAIAIH